MTFDKRLAFRGIRALYGNDGFEKLQSSHVTVIGVGGICAEPPLALLPSSIMILSSSPIQTDSFIPPQRLLV